MPPATRYLDQIRKTIIFCPSMIYCVNTPIKPTGINKISLILRRGCDEIVSDRCFPYLIHYGDRNDDIMPSSYCHIGYKPTIAIHDYWCCSRVERNRIVRITCFVFKARIRLSAERLVGNNTLPLTMMACYKSKNHHERVIQIAFRSD